MRAERFSLGHLAPSFFEAMLRVNPPVGSIASDRASGFCLQLKNNILNNLLSGPFKKYNFQEANNNKEGRFWWEKG